MEWQNKNINPPIVKRILCVSSKTGNMHVVHWDYEEYILSETDEDFPGESVEFVYWMPLPSPPNTF